MLPPQAGLLPGLSLAGCEVDGVWENGFVCYVVPIGSDTYVKEKMRQKVEEVAAEASRARRVLGRERQGLWALLRQSFAQQLDWWPRAR